MAGHTSRSKVDWYGQDVLVRVANASDALIAAIAHQIEGRAKANIVDNDQIDTGFMLNSVYAVTPESNTYAETWPSGKYPVDPKKHDGVSYHAEQVRSPQASLPSDVKALVAVGASYAVYQELDQSFLYKAVEQVQGEVTDTVIAEMAIQTVARETGLTD